MPFDLFFIAVKSAPTIPGKLARYLSAKHVRVDRTEAASLSCGFVSLCRQHRVIKRRYVRFTMVPGTRWAAAYMTSAHSPFMRRQTRRNAQSGRFSFRSRAAGSHLLAARLMVFSGRSSPTRSAFHHGRVRIASEKPPPSGDARSI